MKTIEEIKHQIAKKYHCTDLKHAWVLSSRDEFISLVDECMHEYAKQTAIAQRDACLKSMGCTEENLIEFNKVLNTKLVVD